MRVLITGGSGLLGPSLVNGLLAAHHEVVVLSRAPQSAGLPKEVQVMAWDGRTAEGWGHLAGEVDAIVNLAGANIGDQRWSPARKALIRDSRVRVGQAVVAAVAQAARKPSVLIQASGINAYGETGDRSVDESAPFGTDFLSGVAVDWETSTREVASYGVRQVVVRTGLVMTPSGGWMRPLLIPFRLFVGGPLGSGKQWWSWIHIRDYVQAVLFLLQSPDSQGVYNLVSPNTCRMDDFGRTLASVLKRPYWFPVPAFVLKWVLGEMSILVLSGERVIPRRLQESGYRYAYPELRPALEDLFG